MYEREDKTRRHERINRKKIVKKKIGKVEINNNKDKEKGKH
jgi:hypothetical protein